ncbi:MAG: general secretion pathway protein GspK [Proteobacteria bacterium]|nr:general secretion pathway protein GspK [Pseudomonadota bacterium]
MNRRAPCERSGSPRRARGLALVTVLWVLMLLALIAASFTRTTRTEVNLTRNLIENAEAEALADAGVYRAVLALLAPQTEGLIDEGMESLIRLGSENPAVARRRIEQDLRAELEAGNLAPEAAAAFTEGWRSDGTVYAWAFGGGEVRISIQDEGGKIDLNGAPDELLRGLFLAAAWTGPDGEILGLDQSEADALVDAIRDFADADDLKRLNGAEDRDYEAAGLPWGAKDAAFTAVEELQQVLGVTAPLYQAVAPALTVHTGSKGIDAKSAPREVLMALPGSEAAAVDAYLAARAEAPEGAGPAFLGAEGLSARSRRRVYTIHAEARAPGGAVFAREAVVRLGGGARGYRIEAWKQGRRASFGERGSAAETE